MKSMQSFYEWLFQRAEAHDAYKEALVQLTQTEPVQVAELESELGWLPWDATAVETATP